MLVQGYLFTLDVIIIFLVITFMRGIYNHIPETNHVSRLYSVAAVLHYNLYYIPCYFAPAIYCVLLHSTFRSMRVGSNMAGVFFFFL